MVEHQYWADGVLELRPDNTASNVYYGGVTCVVCKPSILDKKRVTSVPTLSPNPHEEACSLYHVSRHGTKTRPCLAI